MAADLTSGIDVDTLVLDTGEKIRLAWINSPELARENRPAEPLANEAKSTLEGLLIDGRASRRGTSNRVVVDRPFILELCGSDTSGLCSAKGDLTSPTQ